VRVVDEHGHDVPPDTPGEVICQGNHVMVGYLNQPEATAQTIVDGWLHTGDVAVVDQDGYIYISDRIKDMIISGGENVYPAEIENVILAHPDVADVAVIGRPSERWGETPLAVVVRRADTLTEQDVLLHTDGKLARYKRPTGVVFVDEIPRKPVRQGAQAGAARDVPRPRALNPAVLSVGTARSGRSRRTGGHVTARRAAGPA
jgi:acyl-CoA synthetase (AMP-forming)/AMP-acid ligase II